MLVLRSFLFASNHIFSRPCVTRPAGEPFGTPLRTVKRVFGAITGVLLPAASSTAIEIVWTPSLSVVVSIELVSAICDSGQGTAPANSYGLKFDGLMSVHVPAAAGVTEMTLLSTAVTVRKTPPPASATSKTAFTVPDFGLASSSEPRRFDGTGAIVSRSVIAARVTARRIGVVQVFATVPPQPAVNCSWLAVTLSRFTLPETSPAQITLGRQPSMSVLSRFTWYV